jgi:hypothetical protein
LRACAAELYEQIGTLRAERDALKAEVERKDKALRRIADINKGPDRASGEYRCIEAEAIALAALPPAKAGG